MEGGTLSFYNFTKSLDKNFLDFDSYEKFLTNTFDDVFFYEFNDVKHEIGVLPL